MNYNAKALIARWWVEITREQIVVLFVGLEWMFAALVSLTESLFANRVRHVEEVQFVGRVRLLDQRSHPPSIVFTIGRKIENN